MKNALALIRSKAVYFVCGKWPDIVQNELPGGTFSPDKKYCVAILPVEE